MPQDNCQSGWNKWRHGSVYNGAKRLSLFCAIFRRGTRRLSMNAIIRGSLAALNLAAGIALLVHAAASYSPTPVMMRGVGDHQNKGSVQLPTYEAPIGQSVTDACGITAKTA
jgi:hypothetical protein